MAKEVTILKMMESPQYQNLRRDIVEEINSHKVDIDYSCFKKTPLERAQVQNAKSEYKKSLKR